MREPKENLVIPSRCTAKLAEDLDKPYLVAEEKIDGSRYVMYIGAGTDPYSRQKNNTLLSRRVSVVDHMHVDKTANVPHITGPVYEGLEGTVLDGEMQSPEDFSLTNGIMNSAPAEAARKQKESGLMRYRAFDVTHYRGMDIRTRPLSERRAVLEHVISLMQNEHVVPIDQIQGDLLKYFNGIVSAGGEGIIVKDLRLGYGVGWAKMKKSYDVSCVITGYKPGNNKYAGGVGSIALSVYHEGRLVEVGFASGFDDKIRSAMSKDFAKYEGKVVDVFIQELSKASKTDLCGRARHPTFYRFRDDINAEDCTSAKLMADIKAAKTRNSRNKERE